MAIRCPKAKSKNCTNRSCKQAPAGGERCERCRRQKKRAERVAAVEKIEGKRKPENFFGYRNRYVVLKIGHSPSLFLQTDSPLIEGAKITDCHGQQAALAMTPLYKIAAKTIPRTIRMRNDCFRTVYALSAATLRLLSSNFISRAEDSDRSRGPKDAVYPV